MVAAQNATLGGAPFAEGGSPKLAPEHDERVIEQSPLTKVFQQGRNRAIHGPAFVGETIANVFRRTRAVEIPSPIEELDIPDALLDQSPRQKAVVGEARVAGFGTVGLQGGRRFTGDVHHLGHRHLHPEGQLVLGDSGGGLRMS
jgi:hypothetical protein